MFTKWPCLQAFRSAIIPGMAASPTLAAPLARPRTSPLTLIPGGRRPIDRDDALRQVRAARRRLQPREQRFEHLKRVYD